MNYVQRARQALIDNYPESVEPETEPLIDFYTLLVLTRGEETTMEDVHEAWGIWTNYESPEHPSILPFAELEERIQEYDRPYMEAIHKAAAEVKEKA